jgi:hypothetical protein
MRLLPVFLMASLLWGAWGSAHGTTLEQLSLADLAIRSEQAFLGRCVAARTVLIDGEIYTRVSFEIDEMLKGGDAAEVVVHLLGGHHGDRHVHIAGMPTFAAEEAVVLFLTEQDQQSQRWPVGLAQGKFAVRRQAGQKRVFRQLDGVELITMNSAAKTAAPATAYDGVPLERFLDQVRSLVGSRSIKGHDAR